MQQLVSVVARLALLFSLSATLGLAQDQPAGNGDVNGDGLINIADAVYTVHFVFRGGPEPVEILCPPPPPPPPTFPVTARASADLANQAGRSIVSARGNHFIVDSVPPIGGPNEEVNPLDLLLGSLGTCGVLLAEAVANEQEIPVTDISARVEGDFDATGLAGSGNDPRIQKFRVHLELPGANDAEVAAIIAGWQARCPVYRTLIRSAPIEVTVGDEVPSEPTPGLATGVSTTRLSQQPFRAIVSGRGNHFVIDSVPPLGGPNEERNPLDILLGSLGTCGIFLFEAVAIEEDLPLVSVRAEVEADFDPRGFAPGSPIDPRVQAFRVTIHTEGLNRGQAMRLARAYEARCPIFTTLVRSAGIEIDLVVD